jgi:Cd2+/Zn2+-exporting ATPase
VVRGFVLTALTLAGLVGGLIAERFGVTWLEWSCYTLAFLAGGIPAAILAIGKLWRERKLDVNLLMVVAALGAAYVGHADEGAILLFLFSLSNTLQDWAMNRASNAIRALQRLYPDQATVRGPDGSEMTVSLEMIHPGDVLVVRPGERVAADAVVLEGASSLDESAITGESVPVDRGVGDSLRSGTLNGEGVLAARVEKPAGESTLAKLIQLVERAQAAKSPTERFADRFEGPYTIGVLLVTPVIFLVMHYLVGLEIGPAWYRAITFLVVVSPCAVVISTPAAMLSAMAAGARAGVLFKSGAALEALSRVNLLAFDKTGTLTQGQMRLVAVIPFEAFSEPELHALAAGLERHSEHPIARAITEAFEGSATAINDVQGLRGKGVIGQLLEPADIVRYGGTSAWAGTRRFALEQGANLNTELEDELARLEAEGLTTMLLGCGSGDAVRVLGLLAVADTPRLDAHAALETLHRAGIRTVMLTGDRRAVAEHIARDVGVDEVRAELLPEDKLTVISSLRAEHSGAGDSSVRIGMVGDGVNDAPALAAADVGISMGSGSDVALESADVVLMKNDLSRLAGAVSLARATMRTVRFNLTFALGVITIVGTVSLFGKIPLPLGVIAHEGGTVFVCLVGLRLLTHRVRA